MELQSRKTSIHTICTDDANSFHRAISSVLVTAQCFGVMPVSGIIEPSAKNLRFRWWNIRTVYCLIITLGMALNLILSFLIMKSGINFEQSDSVAFFGGVTAMYLLFLQLARQWPILAVEWENLEICQNHYGYPRFLNRKVKFITTIIMVGALVEHILSKATGIILASRCADNLYDLLCHYFTQTGTYNQIFVIMNYNVISAVLTLTSNFISTFLWNFTDLFIILTSIALADRFRLYNKHLVSIQGKILPESYWIQVRKEYNNLASLTRNVDNCISKIIFVSYGNNLYFICRQLLLSLSPIDGVIDTLYFCWSFGFLLLRAVMLSLYAASIYEESKQPSVVLYSVPSESYTPEVERLLTQVTTDTIALTGMNFFDITRTFLLTLAGTIVTYELVLVQFNSINTIEDAANPKLNITKNYTCQHMCVRDFFDSFDYSFCCQYTEYYRQINSYKMVSLLGNVGSFLSIFLLNIIIITQIALLILESAVAIIQSYVFAVLRTLYSREVN